MIKSSPILRALSYLFRRKASPFNAARRLQNDEIVGLVVLCDSSGSDGKAA